MMVRLESRLRRLWRNLVHRDRVERDLDDELQATIALLAGEAREAGLPPDEAARRAQVTLGGLDAVREGVRDVRAGAVLESVARDVAYAARMLRANPGFTFVAVLSLAAGIGANAALFSVADALVWRTLAVKEPARLHTVRIASAASVPQRFSYPVVEDLRQSLPDPQALAAMSRVARMRLQIDGGDVELGGVQLVSGNFFGVFGVGASVGRLLGPWDNRAPGAHPVAVLSHAFWQRRFAAAPDVVGRTVTFNGSRFTVVGVAGAGFTGAWLELPVDAWLPIAMQADVHYAQNYSFSNGDDRRPWMPQREIKWLDLVVRAARPDGPEAAALDAAFRGQLADALGAVADPNTRRLLLDQHLALDSFAHGASRLRDRFRTPVFALLFMTAVLLSIACANTANLLLARAASRQREMAVRLSMGASRVRVAGQLLIESLLLGSVAAVAGLAIAPVVADWLVRTTIGVSAGPLPFSVSLDGRVLAYTLAIAFVTSVLFGMAPAWRATDLAASDVLKSTSRGIRGGRRRVSRALVAVQVGLSLLLVVGAALSVTSLRKLGAVPLGFDSEHVVSAWIAPRTAGYDPRRLPTLYRRLVEAAVSLPGVQSASMAMCPLMTGCRSTSSGLVFTGYDSRPGERVELQENFVGPGYFETVGMRLVSGRVFTGHDVTHPETVAIINEAAARRYFAGRSPIGQRFGEDTPTIEIVGVVRDARVNSVRDEAEPMAFYPLDPTVFAETVDVRVAGDPQALVDTLRKTLTAVDPAVPVERVMVASDQVETTLRQERLIARLSTVVGSMALGLACLGLFGVMSYAVKQRTSELGIRLALGASRVAVLRAILGEALLLVAAGVVIGLPAVLATTSAAATLFYDMETGRTVTIAASAALLLAVGVVTGLVPAWRASRVDPLVALRHD